MYGDLALTRQLKRKLKAVWRVKEARMLLLKPLCTYGPAPWEHIHIDFAGPFLGKMFLVVTDAHSKWPEILLMRNTTATHTIIVLRDLSPPADIRQRASIQFRRIQRMELNTYAHLHITQPPMVLLRG